jgi:hypothetical protein
LPLDICIERGVETYYSGWIFVEVIRFIEVGWLVLLVSLVY